MVNEKGKAISVLVMNTLAFTVCFAAWTLFGVLVTFLTDNGVFDWDKTQMGLLIGTPVLTGSIMRLPVGILTDKYGGRVVHTVLLLISALAMYLVSFANDFNGFLLGGLGFGLSGASFAVGIAYTSLWFSKERQGTALGIFGAGNAGAAITSLGAPSLLTYFTGNAQHLDGWRLLPQVYAYALLGMAILFLLFTHSRKVQQTHNLGLSERLAPLRNIRVWRFGLYYFLVFGVFVGLSQWLIPYYVSAYQLPLATAGLMASIYSLPSGAIRALGGWLSDRLGARRCLYLVLISCCICSALLIIPPLDTLTPGQGVTSLKTGVVTAVTSDKIMVGNISYPIKQAQYDMENQIKNNSTLWPVLSSWQEAVIRPGDHVKRKQLLAKGVTRIQYAANVGLFTGLVFFIGIMMGIGKAAVYKYIPDYFPNEIGVVGGIVGVIGGLGGFVCPIIFGYLLDMTGLWSTCWMFIAFLSSVSLYWMYRVVSKMDETADNSQAFATSPEVTLLNPVTAMTQ
jgi:NNP family nitrate/nitrite transporter-like MFS transporter